MKFRKPTRSSFRPLGLGAFSLLAALTLSIGCSDSDEPDSDSSSAGSGGADVGAAGSLDQPSAGDSSAGAAGQGDGALPITANRPERRDFSPALLAQLRAKPGFAVQVFASDVSNARMLAVGPDGSIYVTQPMTSEVTRLTDADDDGSADDASERVVVASAAMTPALEGVHGIAFHEGKVYLASTKSVVVASVAADGSFTAPTTLIDDLPDGGQHPYRTLAVGPDGLLYVSVGSDCNACPESNSEHAAMLRFNLDGTVAANPPNPAHPMLAHNPLSKISPRVWASGLRNTIGFDWHPVSGELWGIDQGSDGLGEETPPEEFNVLSGGSAYGWPYCWGDQNPDPTADDPSQTVSKADYCKTTEASISSGLPAHSSPIAFTFYRGDQYPAEYMNDGFLVLRGSWGRVVPDGYKVVRIHFDDQGPAVIPGTDAVYEDFLAGFLIDNGTAHFGRIAGLTVDSTGSLLVSDDTNGMIYRVSYDDASGGAGGSAP